MSDKKRKNKLIDELNKIKQDFVNELSSIRVTRNKKIQDSWNEFEIEKIRKSL